MASFYGGDHVGAVVADVGHYATKIGWAGDDTPRSYFRSNVAVLRDVIDDSSSIQQVSSNTKKSDDVSSSNSAAATTSSTNNDNNKLESGDDDDVRIRPRRRRKRTKIRDIRYDYYTHPIIPSQQNDGQWTTANPVNKDTGLWYDPGGIIFNDTATTTKRATASTTTTFSDEKKQEGDSQEGGVEDNVDPADDGADWYDLLPKLLNHGYRSSLSSPMENHPLLLIERSYNPPPIRQQIAECLFEGGGGGDSDDDNNSSTNVPAMFLCRDAAACCYGCGRTTATVVDVGYSGITVSPVYDGFVEQKGIRRSTTGLMKTDEYILNRMDHLWSSTTTKATATTNEVNGVLPLYRVRRPQLRRTPDIHHAARLQIARECREMGAGACVNTTASGTTTAAAGTGGNGVGGSAGGAAGGAGTAASGATRSSSSSGFQAPHKSFELPDGTILDIPSRDRFVAASLLLGIPSGSESDDDIVRKLREDHVQATSKQLQTIITEAKSTTSTGKKKTNREGDGSSKQDDDDDNDVAGNVTGARAKDDGTFTEATAVGLSKRRTKRGEATMMMTTTATTTRRRFSNRMLNRACASYLQTHMDEHLTSSPVAAMVCDAAYRCDREQQPQLLGNVVLGGGGACLGPTEAAVPDVLREQIELAIDSHTPGWRVKMLSPGFHERSILAWLGGSILGSLGSFHEMWITKAEYDEWGSAIVNRKCP